MADKGAYNKENGEGKQSFLTFVCNRRTGEFCGRTAGSWAKILIFYVIFYACLAAFWAVMLIIFYQTIDYQKPKWQLEESRIGINPGLGYRPRAPPNKVDSTLIWFKSSQNSTFEFAIKDIKKFLKKARESKVDSNTLDSGLHCRDDGESQPEGQDKYCLFDVDRVSLDSNCSEQNNNFGYSNNEPCVLIKLNRIYNWRPIAFTDKDKEWTDLEKKGYKKNNILITCEGENPADKENIGDIEYYPKAGIPFTYFPFLNKPGYVSPYVWVKFKKPVIGTIINIECKAWAKNIKHDRMDREGSVHFELLID